MKKYNPDESTVLLITKLCVTEKMSSIAISEKLKLSKQVILRILRENNVKINKSGRKFLGGKKIASKKYEQKKETKIKRKLYYEYWYEENKSYRKKYLKEYQEKNLDKIKILRRNYERDKRRIDPIYRMMHNFRTAMYQVLKEKNVEKNKRYFQVLNYSPEELILHLEKLFKESMTWENYGKWHIDHIKPISAHNICEMEDEEFMKCWSLKNLQPLWAQENLSKSNKL